MAALFVTLPSFALAFANVLAEAMVVEKSRGHSQEFAGRLQSCIWGGKQVGASLWSENTFYSERTHSIVGAASEAASRWAPS